MVSKDGIASPLLEPTMLTGISTSVTMAVSDPCVGRQIGAAWAVKERLSTLLAEHEPSKIHGY